MIQGDDNFPELNLRLYFRETEVGLRVRVLR